MMGKIRYYHVSYYKIKISRNYEVFDIGCIFYSYYEIITTENNKE
jgi:hypothetical protein